jgi:hypothetical protein
VRKFFVAVVCLAANALLHAQQPGGAEAVAWVIPQGSQAAGFTAFVTDDGGKPVATLVPPAADPAIEGSFQITHSAVAYRGAILRLRASLRLESPRPGARARLWMRVERPPQAMGLLDDLSAAPVKSDEWTRSEIILSVAADATNVTFGVLSQGGARVQIRDVSITPMRSLAPLTGLPAAPRNLSFQEGEEGKTPPGWAVEPELVAELNGYHAWTSHKGCVTASCAVLLSPSGAGTDKLFGTLMQSFNASAYRGATVEFHVRVNLQSASPANSAHVFVRSDPDDDNLLPANFITDSDSREVSGADWTEIAIAHRVGQDAARISLGVELEGTGGTLWLDDISFHEVPPPVDLTQAHHEIRETDLVIPPPAISAPESAPPDHAQQAKTINAAARLALRYVRNLPDFLCTEVITRAQNQGNKGWRNKDVLAIRVGFERGAERYRLLTVNGKASKASLRSLGGAQTEGEFGSLLEQLFHPHAASFSFNRFESLRGHAVAVYRFEVPLENSLFRLGVGTKRGVNETLSAYNGFVFIDRESNEVLRIEQIADPPPLFPLLGARNVLDYEHSDVGGERYLLPVRAETFVQSTTVTSHNVVEFRDYQKFSAEAKIQFE